MKFYLRGLLSSVVAVVLELLHVARLGGSDRTSRRVPSSSFSETRTRFRKRSHNVRRRIEYADRGWQDQFTSGQSLLGIRPRPPNTK